MPAVLQAPATRYRRAILWTREDCRKLQSMGILPDRWELIEGDIVSKMGTNRPHAAAHFAMLRWLAQIFAARQILNSCSIDVSPQDNPTSEPEPDIVVLHRPDGA
jgi:hypothetical protein